MLLREGHGRAACGADVVVASVATHGRPGTARLLAGLEIVPPAAVAIGDTLAERLDLDAVLARKPQVALVDELAHRNPPGPGRATRWQEAAELLAAGIDVISTVSIGQVDSVADLVEKITGVPALLTVPDPVLLDADEIELVDVTPEALRDRMARGHIYPAGRAGAAWPAGALSGRCTRCASWPLAGWPPRWPSSASGPVPLAVVATPGRPGSGSWSRCPAAQKARR